MSQENNSEYVVQELVMNDEEIEAFVERVYGEGEELPDPCGALKTLSKAERKKLTDKLSKQKRDRNMADNLLQLRNAMGLDPKLKQPGIVRGALEKWAEAEAEMARLKAENLALKAKLASAEARVPRK